MLPHALYYNVYARIIIVIIMILMVSPFRPCFMHPDSACVYYVVPHDIWVCHYVLHATVQSCDTRVGCASHTHTHARARAHTHIRTHTHTNGQNKLTN